MNSHGMKEVDKLERKIKFLRTLFWIMFGTALLVLVTLFSLINAFEEQNKLADASMELLIFSVEVSSYCAELNNMTYEELSSSFLHNFVEENYLNISGAEE